MRDNRNVPESNRAELWRLYRRYYQTQHDNEHWRHPPDPPHHDLHSDTTHTRYLIWLRRYADHEDLNPMMDAIHRARSTVTDREIRALYIVRYITGSLYWKMVDAGILVAEIGWNS